MVRQRDSKKVSVALLTFGALALGMLISIPVYAQVSGATLTGTVTDKSGAVIPNTQISIKNVSTGVTRTVTSDAAGFYTAPNLLPGSYEVTATTPGFATEVHTGITLTVGAQQVLNMTVRVGTVTEAVEVTAAAPAVELASSTIGGMVTSNTIVELPLNGRSWTDLAALQPGVGALTIQPVFNAGADRIVRGFGAELSISGVRPQQNNYRLDGISLNDYGNGGPGSVLGGNLGVDAVQEFSVLTTNYSAEYGKTAGGVVNAITRSGTNQFHGDAYEFLRNSALDARNFFDVGGVPPFKRNQFGGSAGGPIQKGRTFVFADYEAIRQAKGVSVLDIVPSGAARAGNLCSNPGTPPACTPKTVTVDPSAQKYLPLYPLPNGGLTPGGNGDAGFFTFAQNQVVNENFLITRVDHKFSGKDTIFGSFMFDRTPYSSPDALDNVNVGEDTGRLLLTAEETHIFSPSLVNTVRLGYNRSVADGGINASVINPVAADLSLGAQPGLGNAQVNISGGFTAIQPGLNALTFQHFHWNSFQAYEDFFLTRGTHSLKFGGAVERMQMNTFSASLPGGVFTFSTLSKFLTNQPKQFQSAIPSAVTGRGFRQTLFGAYLQDDWHLRRNLTLNLGLRYEMVTVPTEVQGKLDSLINVTDATPHLGSPLFSNPTLRNFEPRVGFAWDPFNNGKTAVRGGFGVFDVLPLSYQWQPPEVNTYPFFARGTIKSPALPPRSFFAGAASLLGGNTVSEVYIEPHPHRTYVMQWNFNVQREITPSVTALVGYVGSRGVHMLYEVDDMNMVIPTRTSAGYLYPSPIGSGSKINPNLGAIKQVAWGGDSFYDSLLIGITKRMSHGFQFQTSYTWGKSIDNSSASVAGDQFTNGISSLDWWNPRLTRGLADFNIGRILVVSATWQLPIAKSVSGPAAWVVDGWRLGAIFKANDGPPFTPTWGTGGDPQGIGNTDDYAFPNRLTGPGCGTLVNPGNPDHYIKTQCFEVPTAPSAAFYAANCDPTFGTFPQCFNLRGNAGRNIIPGPGLQNLDFSVFKDNSIKRISENFKVQFRAEFFNILNHPNFGVPHISIGEGDLFTATGAPISTAGTLTTTTTDSREIQFALKMIW